MLSSRHAAHAVDASRLKDLIAGMDAAVDLVKTGVEGIAIVPFRIPPGDHAHERQADFNAGPSRDWL